MSLPQQLVWFITGTTSQVGFGASLVSSALARGDLVIATGRSQAKLDTLFEKHGQPENLRVLQLDITSDATIIKAVVNQAVGFWGRIDVAVNNAGNGELGLIEETDTSATRRQFETNFFGPLEVTKAILPNMRSRKSGTIVFVGSRSSWIGETPGLAHYAASKAALHAMADGLSAEVSHLGIRLLLLAPGAFRTEIYTFSTFHQENSSPDYDELRTSTTKRFQSIAGTEPGDPTKAMEALVDVVRGEGVATGKNWPATGTALLLGNDAEKNFYAKFDKMKATAMEWADVVRGVWFPIATN
ncbi:hypothetical protein GYMLUDRAFT_45942 [Collybiopsis luxurians FD-317 M1]|uniref:NAD(P)-binding protein n=1 Tax=Collybiopsis luxurians FD-317 M1 TaxID=944289 RepID=A0A0D0B3B1_9AGAR|nr:hypothetical protein GYMLUDRAFT_45942 [Collybiopsis luxurians FD-317 M1]